MTEGKRFAAGSECVAAYNFIGVLPGDLSLKRGEKVVILGGGLSWYKARNENGSEGMVPYNYIVAMHSATEVSKVGSAMPSQSDKEKQDSEALLKRMPWFHGHISREEADRLLTSQCNGTFLIRDSHKYPGDYAVSVSFEQRVIHYRIIQNGAGKLSLKEDQYFDTLMKFVEHFEKNADGLLCCLKHSAQKNGAASGLDGTAFQPDTEKQAVLLKSVTWFHGQIRRAESERLLTSQSNGTFLIRDSNTYPGDYTLSLSFEQKVKHFHITRNAAGKITLEEKYCFDTLINFVEHYQKKATALPCCLKHSVLKAGASSTSANGASLAGAAPTPEKQNLAISANSLSTGGPENQNPATPANGLFSTGLENQSPAASANCLSSESPEKQYPSALANSRSLASAAATPKTQNPVRERGLLHNMFSSLRTYFRPTRQPASSLPPNQSCCSLPGCTRPRYYDPITKSLHSYCTKEHALEHGNLASGPTSLQCSSLACPNQKCPIPDRGGGNYDDYSKWFQGNSDPWVQPSSHVPASAKPPALSPRLPNYECILSRSTRERDVRRQEAEALYVYFKTEHALEHDKSQRSTVGRSTDPSTRPIPAQLRCRTPTCSRQRKPIPSGGGYYDYCSKECRDNKQAFGFAILEASSPEYLRICSKFRMDWTKGQCPDLDYVIEVFCGQTQKRWKDYKARLASKGSPTTVEQYYHGTAIKCDIFVSMSTCNQSGCSICGISREGFNKKHLGKNFPLSKNFALHSSKSHNYTQGSQNHRAVLICDVLPGNKYTVTTTQPHLTAPPVGYDSVHFVPNQHTRLKYPEVVLFEEASILPRYIILYTRDGIERIAK